MLGSKDQIVLKQNFAELIETWKLLVGNLQREKMKVASQVTNETVRDYYVSGIYPRPFE